MIQHPLDQPCTVQDLQELERKLEHYQFCIVSVENEYEFIYEGPERRSKIILVHYKDHFSFLKSLPAFFGNKHYCMKCKQRYNNFNYHKCNNVCKICQNRSCEQIDEKLLCIGCNQLCFGIFCLSQHEANVCSKMDRCEICNKFKTKIHKCNGRWCLNCKTMVEMNHTCFILTEEERQTKKPMQKFSGYIFFDYECMNDNGEHIPNLIVADKICVECLKTWQVQNEHCANKCGLKTFQNNDDFCLWLLAQEHFTCIAHNLRAYDGLFIMKYLANNRLPNDRSPNVNILQCKLMSIQCDKIKLIDSYNFLPFALSQFSKTFGLEDDQYQKGFFPHLANVPANQNKIFPKLPTFDEYGCKFMNTNDKKRFMDWYAVNKNQVFNLNQELLNYCKSDVKILKHGCLTFRELFMQITQENDNGIDPFQCAITLPSVCHYVYRKMFMPSESIALVADHGFDPTQSHSHKQILWLKIMALSQNIYIKHVYNSKNEFKIGKYPVDGYCAETDTVFQFQGCFHHGCRTCFKPETYNPWRRQSMGYVYKETQERSHFIKTQVKNFVEIWEHEWDDMVKRLNDMVKMASKTSSKNWM